MGATATSKLEVCVDKDALCAYVRINPNADHSGLEPATVLDLLRDAKVAVTDDVTARVERLCIQAVAGELPGPECLVAEAVPSQPPVDAQLVLCEALSRESDTPPDEPESADEQRVDYYAQCRLATVEEGGEIGVIIPAKPGAGGVDVLGKSIPARGQPRELTLGEGVRLGDDGKTVFAVTCGLVRARDNKVSVTDVVKINGDVDFSSGSVDTNSDVVVKGTVRDLFSVKTTKSVSVGGAIEAAHVEAGLDVVVRGGIAGKEKGIVRAGDKVVCRYCDAAVVYAAGDVTITKEAVNSRLRTEARLAIPRGSLIGGLAHARGGAEIKELGTEAEATTTLIIGLDPVILPKVAKMDEDVQKRLDAADKIRSAVGPLIANLKRLAPSQRERATELMFEADSIQVAAEEIITAKNKMIEAGSWHEEPVLFVADRIHPGVRLIFEEFEFVARDVVRGPVKIFKRRARDGIAAALLCVNALSGNRRELFCRKYEAELPPETDGAARDSG